MKMPLTRPADTLSPPERGEGRGEGDVLISSSLTAAIVYHRRTNFMNAESFLKQRLLCITVIDRAEDAVPLAEALLAGGLNVMEITFRTAAAAESIRRIRQEAAANGHRRRHAAVAGTGATARLMSARNSACRPA